MGAGPGGDGREAGTEGRCVLWTIGRRDMRGIVTLRYGRRTPWQLREQGSDGRCGRDAGRGRGSLCVGDTVCR